MKSPFIILFFFSLNVSAQLTKLKMQLFLNAPKAFDFSLFSLNMDKNWGQSSKILKSSPNKYILQVDKNAFELILKNTKISHPNLSSTVSENGIWPNAINDIKKHKAYWEISTFTNEKDVLSSFKNLNKIVETLLLITNASGVFVNDMHIVSNSTFLNESRVLKRNVIPINSWFLVGNYSRDRFNSLYTKGMSNFGFAEIEILNSEKSKEELNAFLYNTISYIINQKVHFKKDENIKVDKDHSYKIDISEGVNIKGNTIKINY